jgi:flagellar biogenesis protein FliO
MSSGFLIMSEMILALGLVLGFGFWELWKLRRDKNKSKDS